MGQKHWVGREGTWDEVIAVFCNINFKGFVRPRPKDRDQRQEYQKGWNVEMGFLKMESGTHSVA